MYKKLDFLSPQLKGKRFDEHRIPVELLEDISALQDLIVETAKWLYLKDNVDKSRVPHGFIKGASVQLETVGKGSAIPKLVLLLFGLHATQNSKYYLQAKDSIINSIYAAETGTGNITDYMPERLLTYFNRIGRNLESDESMVFNKSPKVQTVLNKATRKKLVLASDNAQDIKDDFEVYATIVGVEIDKQTFSLLLNNGQRFTSELNDDHNRIIIDALANYEKNVKVLITGGGLFDKNYKLINIDTINDIVVLDPLDIGARLDELSNLKDNWLDGEGIAPSLACVIAVEEAFKKYFDSNLPLPHIFPTVEGGLQAEWSINNIEIAIEFHPENKESTFQSVNVLDSKVVDFAIDSSSKKDWQKINKEIKKYIA